MSCVAFFVTARGQRIGDTSHAARACKARGYTHGLGAHGYVRVCWRLLRPLTPSFTAGGGSNEQDTEFIKQQVRAFFEETV